MNIESANLTLPNLFDICNENISDIQIEVHEVFGILSMLPVNKVIGSDKLSQRMMKYTTFAFSNPFCILVKKSPLRNSFPNGWEIRHALPLFKKGYLSVASNYRLVSPLFLTKMIYLIYTRQFFFCLEIPKYSRSLKHITTL